MENEVKVLKTNKEIYIDLGNGLTKYEDVNGEKHIFRSTIVTNRSVIERTKDTHIVNIDGVGCIIGAKDGKTFAGERRYMRSDYLYTLLTTICLAYCDTENTDINAKVILNLPLQLYQDDFYINQLKEFEKIKNRKVNVDGTEYDVSIERIIPLPEGLLINTLEPEEVEGKRNMFLDFGYGTLDVVISFGYEIELIKTIKNGVSILYEAIAKKLNTTRENIEYYYNIPRQAIINCEVKDITEIKSVCLNEYADDIINILEDLSGGSLGGINKLYFQGGGSKVIYNDFIKYLKNNTVLVNDPVYSNLRVFKTLAEEELGEEIEEIANNDEDNKVTELEAELNKAKIEREKAEEELRKQQEAEEEKRRLEKETEEQEKNSLAEKEAELKAQIEREKAEKKKIEQENEERKRQLEEQLKKEEEERLKAEKEAEEKRKALEEKAKKEEEKRNKKEKEEEEQRNKEIAELEEKLQKAQEEKKRAEEEKRKLEAEEKQLSE